MAQYAARSDMPIWPATEAMFTTLPPPASRISGIAVRQPRKTLLTLLLTIACQSSQEVSVTEARIP